MKYTKSQSAIDSLTAEQPRVTQQNGTQRPFTGLYDGNEKPGIYVRIPGVVSTRVGYTGGDTRNATKHGSDAG